MSNTKTTSLLTLIIIILAGLSFYFFHKQQNMKDKVTDYSVEIQDKNDQISKLKNENTELSKKYQTIFTEKNGSANDNLLDSVNEFFKSIYDYNSSNENDSVKNRRDKALQFSTDAALETVLPKNAENTTPSVTTISTLKDCKVYIESTNSDSIGALVLTQFSTQIGSATPTVNQYMYKIVFDATTNKIDSIENIGETASN